MRSFAQDVIRLKELRRGILCFSTLFQFKDGGGGGNRTPVRELSTLTSTYVASVFKFRLSSLPEAGFSKGYLKKIRAVSFEKGKRAILSESTSLCARQEKALGTLAAIKQPGRNYNRLRLCLVLPFLRAAIGTSVCS